MRVTTEKTEKTRHRNISRCRVPYFGALFLLCALASLLLIPTVAFAKVVITEIQYDPPGTDAKNEWIEILNEGAAAVTITDYRFREAEVNHKIIESGGGTTLEPSGVAVIVQDTASFSSAYPKYTGMVLKSSFSLKQKGEPLGIINDTGAVDFSYTYTPDDRAKGTGATLHIAADGKQVAAPATPGEIAVNPITETNRSPGARMGEEVEEVPEEEVVEDEILEELVSAALEEDAAIKDGTLSPIQSESCVPLTDGRGGSFDPFMHNGYIAPTEYPRAHQQQPNIFVLPQQTSTQPYNPISYISSHQQMPYAPAPPVPDYSGALTLIAVTLLIFVVGLFVLAFFILHFKYSGNAGGKKMRRKRSIRRIQSNRAIK